MKIVTSRTQYEDNRNLHGIPSMINSWHALQKPPNIVQTYFRFPELQKLENFIMCMVLHIKTDIKIILPTIGFLNSFGLIHLTKNGWQAFRVAIRDSRDFLNWEPSVVLRLVVFLPDICKSQQESIIITCRSYQ